MRLKEYARAKYQSSSNMWESDEDLMLAYHDGAEYAFEILYYRYEKPLLNFFYRMVANVVEAENLCQEAFFRVVRARKTYKVKALFKTWIYQIALNLCRDRQRRMKHQSHLSLDSHRSAKTKEDIKLEDVISDPSSDHEKHMESDELGAHVKAAIDALPQDEHLVVVLKEYQDLKISEIADIMNRPEGTVKSLNHRAHKRLRKTLAKYLGD